MSADHNEAVGLGYEPGVVPGPTPPVSGGVPPYCHPWQAAAKFWPPENTRLWHFNDKVYADVTANHVSRGYQHYDDMARYGDHEARLGRDRAGSQQERLTEMLFSQHISEREQRLTHQAQLNAAVVRLMMGLDNITLKDAQNTMLISQREHVVGDAAMMQGVTNLIFGLSNEVIKSSLARDVADRIGTMLSEELHLNATRDLGRQHVDIERLRNMPTQAPQATPAPSAPGSPTVPTQPPSPPSPTQPTA